MSEIPSLLCRIIKGVYLISKIVFNLILNDFQYGITGIKWSHDSSHLAVMDASIPNTISVWNIADKSKSSKKCSDIDQE